MIIDCGTCAVAGPACGDCVVTVLLGMPGVPGVPGKDELGSPVLPAVAEVPDSHAPALAVLADSGLVPPLRLVRGVTGAPPADREPRSRGSRAV